MNTPVQQQQPQQQEPQKEPLEESKMKLPGNAEKWIRVKMTSLTMFDPTSLELVLQCESHLKMNFLSKSR